MNLSLTAPTLFATDDSDITFILSPTPMEGGMALVLSDMIYPLLAGGFDPSEDPSSIVVYLGSVAKNDYVLAHANLLAMVRKEITRIMYHRICDIVPGYPLRGVKFCGQFRYANEATIHPTPLGEYQEAFS